MPDPAESAIVVPVAAAEPTVSGWRRRYDGSSSQGMPAHVTLLYPFLSEVLIDAEVLAELLLICGGAPVLDVFFERTARFPDVLYLEPHPADGLRHLTQAIVRHWPAAPPYGGSFEEIVPHLTVAHGAAPEVLAEIETDLSRRLPIHARLEEALLCVFDGERWHGRARLPFATARRAARD